VINFNKKIHKTSATGWVEGKGGLYDEERGWWFFALQKCGYDKHGEHDIDGRGTTTKNITFAGF